MRIAIIATYRHPTRLELKERTVMQPAAPELIAGLCPDYAEVEIFNEKEVDIPLDRHWDLVFFSYLHSFYEHTKALSAIFRKKGMKTVAGGRHASYFSEDCLKYFDAVIIGEPESNVIPLIRDFEKGKAKKIYSNPPTKPMNIRPSCYDLIDFGVNKTRIPGIEASRGCPFSCNFCVLTGHEQYRYRPVRDVIEEIEFKMCFNKSYFGIGNNCFIFLDNNLGGSLLYLRELCEALIPLKKRWGCSVSLDVLKNEALVKLMGKAGCRYIYSGVESLNSDSIISMNKGQNKISGLNKVIQSCFSNGILFSFGLLIGSDGDTNEYLERVPDYIADLKYSFVTFLGFVCPYPETPFFRHLKLDGRILPGSISRDYDGFTLCHLPKKLYPEEAVEHFRRLCRYLGGTRNLIKHYFTRLGNSSSLFYNAIIVFSAPTILNIKKILKNNKRSYIAGIDSIEEWDNNKLKEFGFTTQTIS